MDVKLLGCLTELIIILTKVSDEAGIIAFCKSPNSDWHNAKLIKYLNIFSKMILNKRH